MNRAEVDAIVRLCHEAGHLKRSARTGWWRAGVAHPETVAEHSWRTAVIAYFIALAEGADPERTATIAVFHDLPEARTGDIEYVGRQYVDAAPDESIAKDQAAGLPAGMAEAFLGVVRQAGGHDSPEAACARDADKLDCLLQAREYARQGYCDAGMWAQTMAEQVRTPAGRALAAAALKADPAEWWREVAAVHAAYKAAES